jgi:hypothetical protein
LLRLRGGGMLHHLLPKLSRLQREHWMASVAWLPKLRRLQRALAENRLDRARTQGQTSLNIFFSSPVINNTGVCFPASPEGAG